MRSLLSSYKPIVDKIDLRELDLLAMLETWLHKNCPSDLISIKNYVVFRRDSISRGGGVCWFARKRITCKVIKIDFIENNSNMEPI